MFWKPFLILGEPTAVDTACWGRLERMSNHTRGQFLMSSISTIEDTTPVQAQRRLRLLSYNIQAGIYTRHYRQYVTQSWKHVLPHRERLQNLNRIAEMVLRYDIVGLQEVDAGSLRSGFIDQTEYLAHRGNFPYWYQQVNRNLGKLAQHSNGLLSRRRPKAIVDHRLPGLPGRGALVAEFGGHREALAVCIMHLALGRRARQRQVGYISEVLSEYPHVVVMGDLNCDCASREFRQLLAVANLHEPSCEMKTFPSWRPMHNLDHILVSSDLRVTRARVLNYPFSDHLPVSVEILLPESFDLAA